MGGEFEGVSRADGFDGLEWAALGVEQRGLRFGAEFHPSGFLRGQVRLLEEVESGFGDDLGEGVFEAGGGVEVGGCVFADALLLSAVVAFGGVVEGGFDEVGELDESIGIRFLGEGGDDFRRWRWRFDLHFQGSKETDWERGVTQFDCGRVRDG